MTSLRGGPSRPNPNVDWAPAVRQGDVVYTVPAERLNPDGLWRQVERCGLETDDFSPPGLDFESGEELAFGYFRTVSAGAGLWDSSQIGVSSLKAGFHRC
jgi:hypothetical protein